jgi:D-aminopeptidase
MTNFGWLERLTVDGVPVGRALAADGWSAPGAGAVHREEPGHARERGSCVVVLATDAPLLPQQLERLARRAGLGLARTGSTAGHGSGEIFLAVSTGLRIPRNPPGALSTPTHLHDAFLDRLFMAAVEATEEAVVDSLFVADTVAGRDGSVVPGLPVDRTLELLRGAGRLA